MSTHLSEVISNRRPTVSPEATHGSVSISAVSDTTQFDPPTQIREHQLVGTKESEPDLDVQPTRLLEQGPTREVD
jgi:hypothetical protein